MKSGVQLHKLYYCLCHFFGLNAMKSGVQQEIGHDYARYDSKFECNEERSATVDSEVFPQASHTFECNEERSATA